MVRRRSTVRFRIGAQRTKAPAVTAGAFRVPAAGFRGQVVGQRRDPHREDGHVVGRGVGGEAFDRALDAGGHRAGRQPRARGQDVGQAVVAEHAAALAALGDAVGDAEQDIARVQHDGLLDEFEVVHHAEQRLRVGGGLDGAVRAQPQRQRVSGADHAQLGAAVRLRPQLAVEQGEEAAAGAFVEDRGVEALQDRGAAEALAGEQAQRVAGQAGDGGGLGARAAHVADGEAPAALADREEVVEVAADLVALAGRAVDDLDLDAGDVRAAPAAAGCAGGPG